MVLSISSSTLSLYSWVMKTCLALHLISNSWVIFLSVWIVLNSPTCLKVLEMLKWLRYYTNVNSQLFFFTVSVYMWWKWNMGFLFCFVNLPKQNKKRMFESKETWLVKCAEVVVVVVVVVCRWFMTRQLEEAEGLDLWPCLRLRKLKLLLNSSMAM